MSRHRGAPLVAAALPWSWFLLRDPLGAVGDVLAILLPVLVAVAFVAGLAAARRRRSWLVAAASVLAFGVVTVTVPWLPADAGAVRPGAGVTVVAANVRGLTDSANELTGAQVLVVSEYPAGLGPLLASRYPYRLAWSNEPGVAVFSTLPLRLLGGPEADLPGLRVRVDGPQGPFVLYALHVPRPWFTERGSYQATVAEHHAIVDAVAAQVAAETLPVVVAGDLNSPDRGRDYRHLTAATVDATRDGAVTFTSTGQWTALLLRIDHILVTPGWCGDAARQIGLPGSDHRGVMATVGPCAAPGPVDSP
jgi:Endonuclease/Exonuclease/phosphatase family